jgi:pyruvate,water dikinase
VLINASWGLGESVVSGRVSPDHVVARKTDGETLDYLVGNKDLEICPGQRDGGTADHAVEANRAQSPCLSEGDVRALTELVAEVERFYGEPQDIEFAIADDGWKILQARPITGLRGPDAAPPKRQPVAAATSG